MSRKWCTDRSEWCDKMDETDYEILECEGDCENCSCCEEIMEDEEEEKDNCYYDIPCSDCNENEYCPWSTYDGD